MNVNKGEKEGRETAGERKKRGQKRGRKVESKERAGLVREKVAQIINTTTARKEG